MKNARNTFRFEGSITSVTSLTVTRPNETFASPPGSSLKLSAKSGRMPRLGAMREESIPYFPAGSLRGAIRRAGRNVIRRAVIKETGNDTPWGVDTHYMLTQGVDTTNETMNEKIAGTIGHEEGLRNENPFLSLFGRWRLPGHVGIDNAVPENIEDALDCIYVHGRGARSNDFIRSPEQVEFLTLDEAKKLKIFAEQDSLASEETGEIDDQIKALKKDYRQVKDDDEREEIGEQLNQLDAKKKAVKQAKSGSQESIQRPLEGFEAMKPGLKMSHRMIVQNANDIELGLYLATLREFSRNPYVGGHRSLGCGEISANWQVSYWPEDDNEPTMLGSVKLGADGFEIIDAEGHSVLSEALSFWEKSASSLTKSGINFERFMAVG